MGMIWIIKSAPTNFISHPPKSGSRAKSVSLRPAYLSPLVLQCGAPSQRN